MDEISSRPPIGLAGAVAQSMSIMVPAAAPALVIGSVYGISGAGVWQVYLLATIALVIVAGLLSLASGAGTLPDIAAAGIGPKWGVAALWSLLIAYLFTAAAAIGGAVNYALLLVSPGGVTGHGGVAGLVASVLLAALAWALAAGGAKLSLRALLVLGAAPVALLLAVTAAWAGHAGGAVVDAPQMAIPAATPDLLRQGLVVAFFSFTGFESAAGLAGAVSPRLVPRALLLSVVLAGLFFILLAYGLVAVHEGAASTLDADAAPLATLAQAAGLPWAGGLLTAGVSLSFFAGLLGSLNAGSRLVAALAVRQLLPRGVAAQRPAAAALAGLAVALSLGLSLRGVYLLDGLGYCGGIAGFGFLIAYLLTVVAVPFYLYRQARFHVWHGLLSLAAIAVLLEPLIGSVSPLPAPPYTFLPAVFLLLLSGGLFWSWLLRRRRHSPRAGGRIELRTKSSPKKSRAF